MPNFQPTCRDRESFSSVGAGPMMGESESVCVYTQTDRPKSDVPGLNPPTPYHLQKRNKHLKHIIAYQFFKYFVNFITNVYFVSVVT